MIGGRALAQQEEGAQRLNDTLQALDHLTNWERRPQTSAMRTALTLEPMQDLAVRLGNPHRRQKVVHVAGTKGKGSTCALVEAGLSRAGLRVGSYASPYVEDVRERVSILGQPVEAGTLAAALEGALQAQAEASDAGTAGEHASWFDLMTAAAFVIFAQADLDWVVLEVGLGGRLDSTNVVSSPEAVVVTNIMPEHTAVLGHTRVTIAAEKAGIIKAGATVVTGLSSDDPAGHVVQEIAAREGCALLRPQPLGPEEATIAAENAAVAGLVLDALGDRGHTSRTGGRLGAWLLDQATLNRACFPGRMERCDVVGPKGRSVPVVLDGAHVPFNIQAVLRDLDRAADLRKRPLIVVVALAADKDAGGFMEVVAKRARKVICTQLPNSSRGQSPDALAVLARAQGVPASVLDDPFSSLVQAMTWAEEQGGWILVTGSLYLIGHLRARIRPAG
jgi:dihydrofolate synthase/folylpolyglutamate synthase